MRSSPSGRPGPSNSCLDDTHLLTHQYRLRRVGYDDARGFYLMKQLVGSIRRPARSILLALVLAFLGGGVSAFGQAPNQQGPPVIRSIEIQTSDPKRFQGASHGAHSNKARPAHSESLAEQDIRALYATGAVQKRKDVRRAGG